MLVEAMRKGEGGRRRASYIAIRRNLCNFQTYEEEIEEGEE